MYKIVPIELKDANNFIEEYHRHSKKVAGHRWSLGLMKDNELIGVLVAGRPIARMLDNKKTIEILRVCVKEGHKNANSKLYARAKQIAQLMGFEKIITYTLQNEKQSSLKAIGAHIVNEVKPQSWDRDKRHREEQEVYKQPKYRWELNNNADLVTSATPTFAEGKRSLIPIISDFPKKENLNQSANK